MGKWYESHLKNANNHPEQLVQLLQDFVFDPDSDEFIHEIFELLPKAIKNELDVQNINTLLSLNTTTNITIRHGLAQCYIRQIDSLIVAADHYLVAINNKKQQLPEKGYSNSEYNLRLSALNSLEYTLSSFCQKLIKDIPPNLVTISGFGEQKDANSDTIPWMTYRNNALAGLELIIKPESLFVFHEDNPWVSFLKTAINIAIEAFGGLPPFARHAAQQHFKEAVGKIREIPPSQLLNRNDSTIPEDLTDNDDSSSSKKNF